MQAPPEAEYGPGPRKANYTWLWILIGVLAVCGCGGVLVLGAVLFPVFSQARLMAQRTACLSNAKQMALAVTMYEGDYDDKFPATSKWIDLTEKYIRGDPYTCPALRLKGEQYGYAMSTTIKEATMTDVADPRNTVLQFETADLVRNAQGDPAKTPNPDRHGKGRTETYTDGRAKWVRSGESF